MHGRVLVPLDGSELAETALRFTGTIPGLALRLISVEPVKLTAARRRAARGEWSPLGTSWLVSSAATYLNLLAVPLRAQGRSVEVVVTIGKPGPRIVEASTDVDLIIMATRGAGGSGLLVGSTADYVVRHAGVPTLLLRDEHAVAADVTRIVVPLDGSARAEDALPVAAAIRRLSGATLRLVQVIDPSTSLATTHELTRAAEAYLERQVESLDDPAGVSCEVRLGRADEQLLDAVRAGDLFVMTPRSRGWLGRLLPGDVSSAVIGRSPVPVVLVPEGARGMASALGRASG